MAKFSLKEKLKHYTEVASGKKKTESESNYTEAEQRAYARGQRDARNENNRIYASQHATPEQKESYKLKKARERLAYLEQKEKSKKSSKK